MAKRTTRKTRMRPDYNDRHHLLWPQHDWNKGCAKALRDHWYMVVQIPMNTLHRTIHYEIMNIPVPRGCVAKDILFHLNTLENYHAINSDDTIEKRLTVMMALTECVEPETYSALKQQLDIVRKFYS